MTMGRRGKYGAYDIRQAQIDGPISMLTREQDRALRAKAWRHVRSINAKVARKVWLAHRRKTRVPKGTIDSPAIVGAD
jgi:hypothetical protein